MILPDKHLPLHRSLLAVGAELLQILSDRPRSVSTAWEQLRLRDNKASFEQFTLAVSFLFTLDALEFEGDKLQRNVR